LSICNISTNSDVKYAGSMHFTTIHTLANDTELLANIQKDKHNKLSIYMLHLLLFPKIDTEAHEV